VLTVVLLDVLVLIVMTSVILMNVVMLSVAEPRYCPEHRFFVGKSNIMSVKERLLGLGKKVCYL
jgi:hypothetical protein